MIDVLLQVKAFSIIWTPIPSLKTGIMIRGQKPVFQLYLCPPERIKVSAAFPPVSEPVKAFPVFIHLVLSECHWNYHGHCLAFVCVYLCFPEIE